MANQMIALQTRGAKLPDPSAQTAKFASMMNASRQLEASQRQADIAQKTLGIAEQRNQREADLQPAAITKAEIDNIRAQIDDLEEQYKMVSTEEGHQFWLGRIRKIDPVLADQIGMFAPNFDREKVNYIMLTAKQAADKIDPDAKATVEYAGKGGRDEQGLVIPEGTGIQVITGSKPSTRVIPSASAPAAAPKTFVAPTAPPTAPPPAEATNPFAAGYKPNSAAAPVNSLSLVVDSALETGVMAKADFDKLVRIAQPGSGPKLEAWTRQHNITIAPDAPGVTDNQMRGAPANLPSQMAVSPMSYDGKTPPADFAVYRGQPMPSQTAGLAGAPPMQNTMAQYQPLQGRNREASPIPGIYSVPTGQVAATSQAQRETAGEVYAKEKARAKAQREALLEAGPKPLTVPQEAKLRDNITKDYKSARSTIDMMLNPVAGVVAAVNNVRKLSPDQKEAITGYSGYLPTMYASTKSADTAVKNLKGKVTEMGKSVAALTGAIGQMAVQEWRIVSDMIANLDLEGMGAADLDNQLDIIEAQARRAATVTRDAYENQYVEEFDRYPGRFRLPDASAFAAPAAKRRTPTKGAVDRNNPLLRN